MWDTRRAVVLATEMEAYASLNNLHVALTGGCLYKDDSVERKDADFVIYRHNTPVSIDTPEDLAARRAAFEKELEVFLDVEIKARYGYLTKAVWDGRPFDLLYPELRKPGEEYQNQDVGWTHLPPSETEDLTTDTQ